MSIPISLPDSLRDFLEEEMRERGHESLDACAAFLLERARRTKPPCRTIEVDGQTYRLTRLSDSQYNDAGRSSIAIEEDLPFPIRLVPVSRLGLGGNLRRLPVPVWRAWEVLRRLERRFRVSSGAGSSSRGPPPGVPVQSHELSQRCGILFAQDWSIVPTNDSKNPSITRRMPRSFPARKSIVSRLTSPVSWKANSNR